MRIPVFLSCPTILSNAQNRAYDHIDSLLNDLGLEPRTLGRTDYPNDYPLREVLVIAKHCSGGIILGFEQFRTNYGHWKPETAESVKEDKTICFPTPWNHLESGILFALDLPLLVFKESLIHGGVFDPGVTDVFIHKMPMGQLSIEANDALKQVILKWRGRVSSHYYCD